MKRPIPRRDDADDGDDLTPFARVMRSRARPHKVLDFPGLDGVQVALVVPSDEEEAAAQAAALHHLTGELKLDEFKLSIAIDQKLYESERDRQLLARVLRDPKDPDASFATVDELREHLGKEVREVLMRLLTKFRRERSPETELEGKGDELVELIRDLKDDGVLSDYLTSCAFDTLVSIALSLAEALPTRTRPSSTDTSSSSTPSTSTSDPPSSSRAATDPPTE